MFKSILKSITCFTLGFLGGLFFFAMVLTPNVVAPVSFVDKVVVWFHADKNAAWFSGFGTWFAAFGTIFTLVFLIIQNQKNQELNNHQLKAVKFQNYREHISEFDKLIDDIEQKFCNEVKITSRQKLYKKLFPKNNFEICNYSYIVNEDDVETPLNITISNYRVLRVKASHYDYEDINYNAVIHSARMLINSLNVNFSVKKEGDVLFDGKKVMNIFEPTKTFHMLDYILNELISFGSPSAKLNQPKSERLGLFFEDGLLEFISESSDVAVTLNSENREKLIMLIDGYLLLKKIDYRIMKNRINDFIEHPHKKSLNVELDDVVAIISDEMNSFKESDREKAIHLIQRKKTHENSPTLISIFHDIAVETTESYCSDIKQ